jgi:CelD/BcsL family acetyltransferase involved in cellulose biosynthesis
MSVAITPPEAKAQVDPLDALAEAWNQLATDMPWPTPMHFADWLQHSVEFGIEPDSLMLMTACAMSGAVTAVAPMVKRGGLCERIEMAGGRRLFEVADFVYRDREGVRIIIEKLLRLKRPVLFERLPAGSAVVHVLEEASVGKAFLRRRDVGGCPYIPLDASWVEPEQKVNSGRRSDLRRARRHGERTGPMSVEIHAPTPDDVDSLLDLAYAVEAKSWKGESGTALLLDRPLGAFYRAYMRREAAAGLARIAFLKFGDEIAAMQMAIEANGGFWLLKIGHSDSFGKASPGVLLMIETIRHAARNGLESYEFLGGNDTWIRQWTQHEHPCVRYMVYPYSLRGLLQFLIDGSSSVIRKLRAPGRSG